MLITLARKPLTGSVVQNVLAHGCGALNVDACRIGTEQRFNSPASTTRVQTMGRPNHSGSGWREDAQGHSVQRRWPANVVLSGNAVEAIDAQGGDLGHSFRTSRNHQGGLLAWKAGNGIGYGDKGGASRFFKKVGADPC